MGANASVTIKNSVNTGNITGGSRRGGLLGSGTPEQIENCYWVYSVSDNIGCPKPNGQNSASYDGSFSFVMTNTACYLAPTYTEDLLQKLNNWVSSNSGTTTYKRWKYDTIDGYACPVLE